MSGRVVLIPIACCPKCRTPYDAFQAYERMPGVEGTPANVKPLAESIKCDCGGVVGVNVRRVEEALAGRPRIMAEDAYRERFPDGAARVIGAEDLRRLLEDEPSPEPPGLRRLNLSTIVALAALVLATLLGLFLGAHGGSL